MMWRTLITAAFVGPLMLPMGTVAQGEGCYYCDTHYFSFCFGCHDHCWLSGVLHTNAQNHDEDCEVDFPYNCSVDHEECGSDMPDLISLARAFDSLVFSASSDEQVADFVTGTLAKGVEWRVTTVGVVLEAYCAASMREHRIHIPTKRASVIVTTLQINAALHPLRALRPAAVDQ